MTDEEYAVKTRALADSLDATGDHENWSMLHGLADRLSALSKEAQDARDNYDGALADTSSAVDVLIRRINGEADLASAAEWVRLNYPAKAAALSKEPQEVRHGAQGTKPTEAMLRALADAYRQHTQPRYVPWISLDPGTQATLIGAALFAWEAALSAAPRGEGWVSVPVEPTEAMLNGARDWAVAKYGIAVLTYAAGCWAAMLAARPLPSPPEEGKPS